MDQADASLRAARSAKAAALEQFGAIAEVMGVGITRIAGSYGLKVNIRRPIAADISIPEQVNGVPVRVEVVGSISPR